MFKFFTLSFAIVFSISSFAQINNRDIVAYTDYTNVHAVSYKSFETNFLDEIDGFLYLNEAIGNGYFIDTILKNKVKVNLRYDAYNDIFKIYLDLNKDEFKLLERTKRFEYELNREKFVLIETDLLNVGHFKQGRGYVVELTDPEKNVVLYKRYHKKLNPGSVATSSYESDINPSLNTKLFYIIKLGNNYLKAETNTRKILECFPKDKQDKLEKFIKSNNLKFRGDDTEVEQQMIYIVNYYNTL